MRSHIFSVSLPGLGGWPLHRVVIGLQTNKLICSFSGRRRNEKSTDPAPLPKRQLAAQKTHFSRHFFPFKIVSSTFNCLHVKTIRCSHFSFFFFFEISQTPPRSQVTHGTSESISDHFELHSVGRSNKYFSAHTQSAFWFAFGCLSQQETARRDEY